MERHPSSRRRAAGSPIGRTAFAHVRKTQLAQLDHRPGVRPLWTARRDRRIPRLGQRFRRRDYRLLEPATMRPPRQSSEQGRRTCSPGPNYARAGTRCGEVLPTMMEGGSHVPVDGVLR